MPVILQDFLTYVQNIGGLVMLRAPYLGRIDGIGLDSLARTTTVGGSPQWEHRNGGFGFDPRANGRLTTPDGGAAAEIALRTAGTLVALFDAFDMSAVQRIASKLDAGGTSWEWYVSAANTIAFTDGVTPATLAAAGMAGARSAAVKFSPNVAPSFYVNGGFLGVGGASPALAGNDADLSLGATYLGANPLLTPLKMFLAFAAQLTDEQNATIHDLLINLASVDREFPQTGYDFYNLPPTTALDDACIESFGGDVTPLNTIVGTKGVSVGTLVGQVCQFSGGPILPGAVVGTDDNNYITLTNPASLLNPTQGAIELFVDPTLATPPAGRWILVSDANLFTVIEQIASGKWRGWKGPASFIDSVGVGRPGTMAHLFMPWWLDGATRRFELYLNGVLQGASTFPDGSAPTTCRLLGTTTVGWKGKLFQARFYNRRITATEVMELYQQHAKAAIRLMSRNAVPVTLTNKTAGNIGKLRIASGTWSLQDSGLYRKIVNVGVGILAGPIPKSQPYGGWYFRAKRDVQASDIIYEFVKDSESSGYGPNGYMVHFSSGNTLTTYLVTAGVPAVLTSLAGVLPGIEYEFYVGRRYDGLLRVYVRGGAYLTWTALGNVTNNAHKTSVGIGLHFLNNTGNVSCLTFLPMGGTLDPSLGDLDNIDWC